MSLRVSLLLALLIACGCASHSSAPAIPQAAGNPIADQSHSVQPRTIKKGAIKHVVVIVQENRSFNNLFMGFPKAKTQNFGLDHNGNKVTLVAQPMVNGYEPAHGHSNFVTQADYNGSVYKMDGFDLSTGGCYQPSCVISNYEYVQSSDVVNYWALAQQFALADETFQPNMGSSWTSHQYLIAGQAGGYSATHDSFYNDPTGGSSCYNPSSTLATIDMTTAYPGKPGTAQSVCVSYPTILDELDSAGVSWKYYARSKDGYWTSPPEFLSLFNNDKAKIIFPKPTQILSDITNHALPQVSFVTPIQQYSDHPGPGLTNHGQDFVASITNAIGGDSYYWPNTVVILTWDDWGGFYDPVPPPHANNPAGGNPDPMEYGMRVPFLVIGPYVIHKVDHKARSTVAILDFLETVFSVPSLQTLDTQSDNLAADFNFSKPAKVYQQLDLHGWVPPTADWEAKHGGAPDDDMGPGSGP